jgi:hypothetical protein
MNQGCGDEFVEISGAKRASRVLVADPVRDGKKRGHSWQEKCRSMFA